MAQSAVNSVLGSLSSVLVGEAKLLIGVRGDVQFIRDEMESMKGFLQDLADVERPNNQVRAWMRQVQDLADDSEGCIIRYMHTFGSRRQRHRTAASFLQRVPQLVRTVPARHRIASEIRELKARACEVGERRKRYGVTVPSREPSGSAIAGDEEEEEEEDPWSLPALVDPADNSAQELVSWLIGRGPMAREHHSSKVDDFLSKISDAMSKTEELAPGLTKIVKGILGGHDDQQQGQYYIFDKEQPMVLERQNIEIEMNEELRLHGALVRLLVEATCESDQLKTENKNAPAAPHGKQLTEWLVQSFGDVAKDAVVGDAIGRRWPKLLAIVTPALDVRNPGDEKPIPGQEHKSARDLAMRVYHILMEAKHFDCMAWVDGKVHCEPRPMLQSLLIMTNPLKWFEVDMSKWTEEKLSRAVSDSLKGRKFLIVLVDYEDDEAWKAIGQALPPDCDGDSAIILAPSVQQTLQFHGWYIASWLQLPPRLKVHFHSTLSVARKMAGELLDRGSEGIQDLRGIVWEILKKCHRDSFSTKMVLHYLYVNPHVRKVDLEKLLLGLKDFSTARNAQRLIRFCYDTLPNHYKPCLLYLSIFPPAATVRRSALVRRWSAENLIFNTRQGRSALDEAEHGFKALVTRGLVLPHETNPQGKVKSCKVHRHVFSFIAKMAHEENVGNPALPPDLVHRFSLRNGIRLHKAASPTYSPTVSPLINLLSTTSQLELVTVLDLQGCDGLKKQHIKTICNKLFQLKYLSLRNTDVIELPKEIEKLQYLETLDIRQTKIKTLPATVVLQNLVHLLAGYIAVDDEYMSTIHIPRVTGSMTKLQILSHVQVPEKAVERELAEIGQLQQLRKLGVILSHGEDMDRYFITLARVIWKLNECLCSLSICIKPKYDEGLTERSTSRSYISAYGYNAESTAPKSLESLSISGMIIGLPAWIKELHQLSKITLCHTSMKHQDNDMRILGALYNLRCIILRYISYHGGILTFKEREFKKLEFLEIEGNYFSEIKFDSNAAPKLMKIVWTVPKGNVILSGIEGLPSLRKIELHGKCDTRRIRGDLEANGNHPLLIHRRT